MSLEGNKTTDQISLEFRVPLDKAFSNGGHGPELLQWPWETPECFKTRGAYFPVKGDERTGMQRATLGKSGTEAAS